MITAVVPAHNEEAAIAATVDRLLPQVDRVVVVCDNCTDDTFFRAAAAGADVFRTVDNTGRKAGGLNQAFTHCVDLDPGDYVMVCDADTLVAPTWVESALESMAESPDVGAVGAVFYADRSDGYLRYCQNLEWIRYSIQVARSRRVFVLSGTAALLRAELLQSVKATTGRYYDESSITEDFAFTLDAKQRGWRLRSPLACSVRTETMPTVGMLIRQRQRWYLGALQQIRRRPYERYLRTYVFQQMMLLLSVLAFSAVIAFTVFSSLVYGFAMNAYWIAIGVVFAVERVVTVWPAGWRARLFASLVVPELLYAVALHLAYVRALFQAVRDDDGQWHHTGSDTST